MKISCMKVLILLVSLVTHQFAIAHPGRLPEHSAVPVGVAVHPLAAETTFKDVYYNNTKVFVVSSGNVNIALVGIPLSASAGTHEITLTGGQPETAVIEFEVQGNRVDPALFIDI